MVEINKGILMKLNALVLFAVTVTLASTPSFAVVPDLSGMPRGGTTAMPVAATKADLASAEQSAKAAQASIKASRADTAALAEAVKAKDDSQARALLQKHGFSARQLEGAKIVLVDKSGGSSAQKTKVKIDVSCCPLTIIITIRV